MTTRIQFTREHLVVGLAPFVDAFGKTRASYQLLGEDKVHSIGTLDICDGVTVRMVSTWQADMGLLSMFAKHHFTTTPAMKFTA